MSKRSKVLSPDDVVNYPLKQAVRGYSVSQVDELLDRVADELERLHLELVDTRRRLQEAEARASGLNETENALKQALITAQRAADQTVSEARERAAAILAEAEQEAERKRQSVVGHLHVEHAELRRNSRELEERIEALRVFERDYRAGLRNLVERHLRALDDIGSRLESTVGAPEGDPAEVALATPSVEPQDPTGLTAATEAGPEEESGDELSAQLAVLAAAERPEPAPGQPVGTPAPVGTASAEPPAAENRPMARESVEEPTAGRGPAEKTPMVNNRPESRPEPRPETRPERPEGRPQLRPEDDRAPARPSQIEGVPASEPPAGPRIQIPRTMPPGVGRRDEAGQPWPQGERRPVAGGEPVGGRPWPGPRNQQPRGVEAPGRGVEGGPRGVEPPGRGVEGGPRGVEPPGRGVEGGPRGVEPPGRGMEGGPRGVEPPGRAMEGGPHGVEPPGHGPDQPPRPPAEVRRLDAPGAEERRRREAQQPPGDERIFGGEDDRRNKG